MYSIECIIVEGVTWMSCEHLYPLEIVLGRKIRNRKYHGESNPDGLC